MQRFVVALLAYALSAAAYLALSGSLDAVEIVCAAASALPAALIAERMVAVSRRRFPIRVRVGAALRPLLSLLPDTIATGRELVAAGFAPRADAAAAQRGGFTRQPFRSGGDEASTRRAAVLIGLSLAPRTFVVRGEASDELLLHALPERPASADREWPR